MKEVKANILLVEDDTNLGYVIQDNLRLNKFHVSLHTDGQSALKAFLNSKIDVCILDVMLPKKDGFELAGEIRELNKSVPIVFNSCTGSPKSRIG